MNIVLAWSDASQIINYFSSGLSQIKISGISIVGFLGLLVILKWAFTILTGNGSGSGGDTGGSEDE